MDSTDTGITGEYLFSIYEIDLNFANHTDQLNM